MISRVIKAPDLSTHVCFRVLGITSQTMFVNRDSRDKIALVVIEMKRTISAIVMEKVKPQ